VSTVTLITALVLSMVLQTKQYHRRYRKSLKMDVSKAELLELRQKYCDALNTKLGKFAELDTGVKSSQLV